MRRIYILFFWIFKNTNNVSFRELVSFLLKPKMDSIGKKFISDVSIEDDFYKINFLEIKYPLFWPCGYGVTGYLQVTSETFDPTDWHFYQNRFKVKSSDILLDVGAAEGLFALSVIDNCQQVILIEPNASFIKALEKTFLPFGDKVKIINYAVGEQKGEVSFSEDSLSGSISEKSNSSQVVSLSTIDELIGEEIKITFFKADIEGFELNMLKGAKKTIIRNKPRIAITSYHTENNPIEIIDLIKSYVPQYTVYKKGLHHHEGKPVMIHFWI